MSNIKFVTILALTLGAAIQMANADTPATSQPSQRVTESGLTIIDVAAGDTVAKKGDIVLVHYTGRLQSNGKKFDSSAGKDPIQFELGSGRVIKGWDEGIAGMKIGEKRQLIIPANLAYGERAMGNDIPANSTLMFDVELVGIIRIAK